MWGDVGRYGEICGRALGGRLARAQVDDAEELAVAEVVGVGDLRLCAELRHEHLEMAGDGGRWGEIGGAWGRWGEIGGDWGR